MSRWDHAEAEFYGRVLPQFVGRPKQEKAPPVRELADDEQGQYGLGLFGGDELEEY